MKFITAVASLALASAVSAAPSWADWAPKSCPEVECPVDTCLQQSDAEDIVNKFISVLNHPDVEASNATAQALIGDDFFEESDSINMLAGHPVRTSHLSLILDFVSDFRHRLVVSPSQASRTTSTAFSSLHQSPTSRPSRSCLPAAITFCGTGR